MADFIPTDQSWRTAKMEKMKCKTNLYILSLALLLLLQLGLLFVYSQKKQAYFIDEMFTFELANYEGGGWVSRDGNVTSVWNTGSFFRDVLKGKEENRFNFSIPYHNQEKDVHPPLHYFFIHLFSSLFPNMDIKWIGLIPNFLFSLLTTVTLYYLAKKMTASNAVAWIIAGVWALGTGAMETAMFIRMYCLLTFLTVLFTALHWPIMKQLLSNNDQNYKIFPYIALAASTTAGMLTQYIFLLYAFGFCALFVLLALALRRWKVVVSYMIFELGAVGAGILIFPGCIQHIFSSYRGEEAMAGLSERKNGWDSLITLLSYISNGCFNGWAKVILIVVIVAVLLLWLNRKLLHIRFSASESGILVSKNIHLEHNMKQGEWRISSCSISIEQIIFLLITFSLIFSLTLLVRIIPYNTSRYIMNYYPLGSLWLITLIYWSIATFIPNRKAVAVILFICLMACTLLGHKMQNIDYLYEYLEESNVILQKYQEYPVITLTNGEWDYDADSYMYQYQFNPMVFRCSHGNFSDLKIAFDTYDLRNGFLLYAANNYAWMMEDDLFAEVEKQIPLSNHEFLTHLNDCSVWFCVPTP